MNRHVWTYPNSTHVPVSLDTVWILMGGIALVSILSSKNSKAGFTHTVSIIISNRALPIKQTVLVCVFVGNYTQILTSAPEVTLAKIPV